MLDIQIYLFQGLTPFYVTIIVMSHIYVNYIHHDIFVGFFIHLALNLLFLSDGVFNVPCSLAASCFLIMVPPDYIMLVCFIIGAYISQEQKT